MSFVCYSEAVRQKKGYSKDMSFVHAHHLSQVRYTGCLLRGVSVCVLQPSGKIEERLKEGLEKRLEKGGNT